MRKICDWIKKELGRWSGKRIGGQIIIFWQNWLQDTKKTCN
jgi:hypothetical protein